MHRINEVLKGETGASNLEIIVWMAVVLMIAVALFLFKDAVKDFIATATKKVNGMTDTMSSLNISDHAGSAK